MASIRLVSRLVAAVALVVSVANPGASLAREPVIGGPCENCDIVFSGLPTQLTAQSRIAPPTTPGEPMIIVGTVRTAEGKPAAGIIVYAYHTNADGIYPRSTTLHGALRGWARTDEGGNYRFDTIRPGAYPGRDNPQHVHMHVIEPGKGTYWIDDIHFSDDPLLTANYRQRQQQRGGDGVCAPSKDDDGVWHVRRDITLGKEIPGYTASK